MMESEMLYGYEGEVPEEEYLIPIGKARVHREGSDITLVTFNKMLLPTLEAPKHWKGKAFLRK